MIYAILTFTLGCAVGASGYAISGYQPGMIAQLTGLWVTLILSNLAAFVFLCWREE